MTQMDAERPKWTLRDLIARLKALNDRLEQQGSVLNEEIEAELTRITEAIRDYRRK